MSITTLPSLDRLSSSFKSDVNTFFGTTLPTFTTEINAEIDRINAIGHGTYSATSTTSLSIGTGSKSLTIETGKSYAIGQPVLVASTASPTNYMVGLVTSYDAATGALVVNVTGTSGSGTIASWSIGVASFMTPDIQIDSLVVLTSGTSWVCPDGVRKVKLTMSGGGGSGSTGSSTSVAGSDGAGAGTVIAVFPVVAGQTYTYAVGAGGAGVTGTSVVGNIGGNSTFTANGVTYTAEGGGASLTGSASGGSGSGNGAVVIPGQNTLLPSSSALGVAYAIGGGYSHLGRSGTGGIRGTGTTQTASSGKIILELYK